MFKCFKDYKYSYTKGVYMKFSKLFEHSEYLDKGLVKPSKASKTFKKSRYDYDIIKHVRTLIEKNQALVLPSVSGPDSSTPLPKDTGVLLDSKLLQTEREDDYFLSDEAYERLKQSQGDKSNFSEDSADEILGDPVVPQSPEPSEDNVSVVKEEPSRQCDYFLADEGDESDEGEDEPVSKEQSAQGTQCDYFLSDDEEDDSDVSEPQEDSEINESPEGDELKSQVEDIYVTKNIEDNPEAMKVYNKMIELIQDKDYDETVDFVDEIVKDPKLKFLLGLGFGGDFSNLKLKLKKTNIPAKRLIPTQSEIGTDETLKYLVQGKDIDVCFDKTTIIKKPIVTFQGTFIIDGHHRWSQIFVTNPDANIVCIDITGNLSPLSMLKAVQCTIGSNTGKLIRKDIQGKNLYDTTEKELRKYFKDNLSDSVRENLLKYYEDPEGSLVQNVIQLQRNNKPILNAPDRGEMPQTSKDPELFGDLENGVTEV